MDYSRHTKNENKKYSSVSAMIVWKNKMYLVFLFSLMLVYIGNVQYSEYRIRKTQIIEKEITHLKWNYWTMKSGMIYNGMEEQVGKKVSEKELIIKEEAPKVLIQQGQKN
ncbi:MAG: hypothetical protein IPO78_11570 [Saprospiraceae bacterium]|nr:hypothetical protein [Saprospiraceae bacterium]MBK8451456.1 hypothetical protein [Saprospiraceae bacterium]MBK8483410.1 hypothetical protein [Saprospiraceae bacterium]MBK9220921.1 hypothetical protein [Saprospiraceae bacterium]MBK9722234.1 hypothetical protein [Saprospiraceae bacterium]